MACAQGKSGEKIGSIEWVKWIQYISEYSTSKHSYFLASPHKPVHSHFARHKSFEFSCTKLRCNKTRYTEMQYFVFAKGRFLYTCVHTHLLLPMWYDIRRKWPSGGTKDRIFSDWNIKAETVVQKRKEKEYLKKNLELKTGPGGWGKSQSTENSKSWNNSKTAQLEP